MKILLSLVIISICCLSFFAQKPDDKAKIAAQKIVLKKQIMVDGLDNQARDVPLAAVRIFVRFKLAQWLWKDGKDETGRAESLAVRALEELFEKKEELYEPRFLKTDLFGLLEKNAPDAAAKLKAKYKDESDDDLQNAVPYLMKEGGEKTVAEKIKKFIATNKDLGKIAFLNGMLQGKKSPEFVAVLAEIVNLEETGRNNFPASSLSWVVDGFRDELVPNDLKIRFYRIVLNKARIALQSSDAKELLSADNLLNSILPDIAKNAPELSAEATGIKAALSAQTSQKARERQERTKRIEESTDKIGAYISEAEKAEDSLDKYNLLFQAILLAKKEGKFQIAVDLLERTVEDVSEKDVPEPDFRKRFHDQILNQIVTEALGKDDVVSANYAAKRIINESQKADAYRQTANYFYDKKDVNSALDAYEDSLKLAEKADNSEMLKFSVLMRLIPLAQKIDKTRLSEVTTITAGAIDRIPTLNPEDKPGTENFKNYVELIMPINYFLYPAISTLAKENKTEAADFASRINRKEIRIVADLALAIDAIEKEAKQVKTNQ